MALIWKAKDETELIEHLQAALMALPAMTLVSTEQGVPIRKDHVIHEADAVVKITVNGEPHTFLIEAKKSLFPRDAREAVWKVRKLQELLLDTQGREAVPLIASGAISDGAREFLQNEGVSYFDDGGSLFLTDKGLFVLRDRPASKGATRTERSLFTGRRTQVLLGLFQEPKSWHRVQELSEKAFASTATVSQFFTELQRREWVSVRGRGPKKERKLVQPSELLDAWVKNVTASQKPRLRRFYVPSLKAEELMLKINQICESKGIAYAITGEWAAQLYSPFLSSIGQVRLRFPNDRHLSELTSELKAREVNEGSNLAVIESASYGDFLFRERVREVWLANPIVVYLDLLQGEGRAKEMADHLRRERIQF